MAILINERFKKLEINSLLKKYPITSIYLAESKNELSDQRQTVLISNNYKNNLDISKLNYNLTFPNVPFII